MGTGASAGAPHLSSTRTGHATFAGPGTASYVAAPVTSFRRSCVGDFVFMFHSGVRYLVLLAAVLALTLLVMGRRTIPAGRPATTAFRTFVALIDLQAMVGLLVLMTRPFFGALMGHITVMILAAAVAHGTAIKYRRRPEERRTAGYLAAGTLVCLVLIVAGILAIGRPIV